MTVEQYGRPDLRHTDRTARTAADNAVLRFEAAGLRRALRTQATIEQAKGVLMMRYGISADATFTCSPGGPSSTTSGCTWLPPDSSTS